MCPDGRGPDCFDAHQLSHRISYLCLGVCRGGYQYRQHGVNACKFANSGAIFSTALGATSLLDQAGRGTGGRSHCKFCGACAHRVVRLAWRRTDSGGSVLCIALVLQPCRNRFDAERKPGHPLRFASLRETFFEVLKRKGFRTLAGAGFAFIGLQSIYTNFTVVYLAEELQYSLAEAGAAMGLATLIAAPGRIVWGWVGSVWVAPRTLLIGLAVAMALGSVTMGFYDSTWSYIAVMAPMLVVSATALSWHGILLSEVARLADGRDVA